MARHIELTGTLHVPAPPLEAVHFFTPEGEARWLPGWQPEYLHPEGDTVQEGAVFRTRLHGEPAVWLVSHFDLAGGAIDYVRVTPESRIGTVSIRCAPAPEGTLVTVTYRMTALSPAGEQALDAFAGQFPNVLATWAGNIAALVRP